MRTADLGPLKAISRLSLGGGGLGQVWGETDAEEAVATVHAALDAGVNLIDLAPLYGDSLSQVARAFSGAPPAGVRFTSKCYLGDPGEAAPRRLEAALTESLQALGLEQLDIFFLHTNIRPDGYRYARDAEHQDRFSTSWSTYAGQVAPTLERFRAQGRIAAWGITAVGVPQAVGCALDAAPKPQVAQVVTNLLDSAGGMRRFQEPHRPREILAKARANGVGVMGIRAVQAGALCASFDRPVDPDSPEGRDHLRAQPFRELCAAWGEDPAQIAHRYALDLEGVATVVLGVKNRGELAQAVEAERQGPLPSEWTEAIEALGLRAPCPARP